VIIRQFRVELLVSVAEESLCMEKFDFGLAERERESSYFLLFLAEVLEWEKEGET